MRTGNVVNKGIVRSTGSSERFRTHGRADLRQKSKMRGVIERQRCNGCGECGAIKDTEMLLGCERNRFDVMRSKCFAGGDNFTGTESCRAIEDTDRRVAYESTRNV